VKQPIRVAVELPKGYGPFELINNNTQTQTAGIEQSLDQPARERPRRVILFALEVELEQYFR
jgi:hypothetical protein